LNEDEDGAGAEPLEPDLGAVCGYDIANCWCGQRHVMFFHNGIIPFW
jgi:hypothetical protein